MLEIDMISDAIRNYVRSKKQLRELGIANTERQIVSEIGEWLVLQLFGGERAANRTQPDWDIMSDNKRIQVKSHAKGKNNNARYTKIKYLEDADIDELIIVVFSQDLIIKEFYKILWSEAQEFIRRNNVKPVIYWNDLQNYKINIRELPNQEIVGLFN